LEKGDYYFGYSHLPSHTLILPKSTFTITILRDPSKRIISQYKELCYYKNKGIDNPFMNYIGNSFRDFFMNVPPHELMQQLYMFSPVMDVNEAFDKIISCNHYFFTDKYKTGHEQLCKKLNINLPYVHERKAPFNSEILESEIDELKEKLYLEYVLFDRLIELSK